jgi:integrase
MAYSLAATTHYLNKCKVHGGFFMADDRQVVPYNENEADKGLLAETLTAYDDSLEIAGLIADHLTRGQKFAAYHQTKAKNTLQRQQYDLQVFSTYLAQAGITRSADDLYLDAEAWRGMNAGLLEGFKVWMLNEGYAIGSVNLRLSTIRKHCELAHVAGVLSSQDLALIKLVKGFRYSEGTNIDRNRIEQGRVTRIGAKKATPVSVPKQKALRLKHATTPGERTRDRDQLLEQRDALLMCLLIEHALRVSEIVALNASSIDLDAGTLTVYRSKTYSHDTYELMPRTREAAAVYLPLIDPQGPLFSGYDGKRITRYGIFDRVRQLGRLVGIDNLSPHDLRHFWTIDAFRNGNGIDLIQRYGGWNSPAMPLRYAKIFGVMNKGLRVSQ